MTKSTFCTTVANKLRACERESDLGTCVVHLLESMRFLVENLHTVSHSMSQRERHKLIQAARGCLAVNIPLIGPGPKYGLAYQELLLYESLLAGTFDRGDLLLCDPDVARYLAVDVE